MYITIAMCSGPNSLNPIPPPLEQKLGRSEKGSNSLGAAGVAGPIATYRVATGAPPECVHPGGARAMQCRGGCISFCEPDRCAHPHLPAAKSPQHRPRLDTPGHSITARMSGPVSVGGFLADVKRRLLLPGVTGLPAAALTSPRGPTSPGGQQRVIHTRPRTGFALQPAPRRRADGVLDPGDLPAGRAAGFAWADSRPIPASRHPPTPLSRPRKVDSS